MQIGMQKMFEPNNRSNANDPYLINPRGVKIQVPEERVSLLLKQGFILYDPNWSPAAVIKEEVIARTEPLPLAQLKKEVAQSTDTLDVLEI